MAKAAPQVPFSYHEPRRFRDRLIMPDVEMLSYAGFDLLYAFKQYSIHIGDCSFFRISKLIEREPLPLQDSIGKRIPFGLDIGGTLIEGTGIHCDSELTHEGHGVQLETLTMIDLEVKYFGPTPKEEQSNATQTG